MVQFAIHSPVRDQRAKRTEAPDNSGLTLRQGTAHCSSNYDGSTSFQTEEKHTHKEELMLIMCLDDEIRYCFPYVDR